MTTGMATSASDLVFEKVNIGDCYNAGGRTVTEADIVNFAGISGDFNPLHVDREAASRGPFGKVVAHGALIMAIATGLAVQARTFSGALAGIERWRFISPVYVGDTVHLTMSPQSKRITSSGRGIVIVRYSVTRREELVQEGDVVLVMEAQQPRK